MNRRRQLSRWSDVCRSRRMAAGSPGKTADRWADVKHVTNEMADTPPNNLLLSPATKQPITLPSRSLTHSCLEISLTCVVWTCHIFENNFGMKHKFLKYLKEICILSIDEQFSFNYFLNIALTIEISSKSLGGFGCYRHE